MSTRTYAEKLKDPRWQKRRLEILERDQWHCQSCQDSESTLMVHHTIYERGKEPWEADGEHLITLCDTCHESEHKNRDAAAQMLIHELRGLGFLADDLISLANDAQKGTLRHVSGVVSSVIGEFFTDLEFQRFVTDSYFSKMAAERKKKELQNG